MTQYTANAIPICDDVFTHKIRFKTLNIFMNTVLIKKSSVDRSCLSSVNQGVYSMAVLE